ncbi:hypothetical protein D6833_06535, partial [Candidatus Parcubacteria bacterium]
SIPYNEKSSRTGGFGRFVIVASAIENDGDHQKIRGCTEPANCAILAQEKKEVIPPLPGRATRWRRVDRNMITRTRRLLQEQRLFVGVRDKTVRKTPGLWRAFYE